jgi:hypothetical protein
MLKFKRRITQKITISRKPISIGFKIFALNNSGYILNWEYIRLEIAKGILWEKKRISISNLNSSISTLLNPIQSVIIRFISYLSIYINNGLSFHLFLNNLFIFWKSAIALKERKIVIIKTVRKGASGYPPVFYSSKRRIEALYKMLYKPLLLERFIIDCDKTQILL